MPAVTGDDDGRIQVHLNPDVPVDHVIINHLLGEIANDLGVEKVGEMDVLLKVRYADPGYSFMVYAYPQPFDATDGTVAAHLDTDAPTRR